MRRWATIVAIAVVVFTGAVLPAVAIAGEVDPAEQADVLGPTVQLRADRPAETFATTHPVVDDLAPQSVLRVQANGFEAFDRARIMQCITRQVRECANPMVVQLDGNGAASFQFLVTDHFTSGVADGGRCRPDTARCSLAMASTSGDEVSEIDTVFAGPARPVARIVVDGGRRIVDGETVQVDVSGFPAGRFDAVLCEAPRASGTRHCGEPGPSAPMVVAADGTGTAELAITQGPVGSTGSRCDRRTTCGVAVIADDRYVRASAVPITFAGRAGPDYETGRLATGLGIALALVALATGIAVTGEWRPPQEASTPAMDDAEYADLDAMVAAQDAAERDARPPPDGA